MSPKSELLLMDLNPRPEQAIREVLEHIRRIQRSLRQSLMIDGQPLHVSVSMGITLFLEESCETASGILTRADTALHRAKGRGGNCYRFYESSMGQQVIQNFDLESDLRKAMEEGQLALHL